MTVKKVKIFLDLKNYTENGKISYMTLSNDIKIKDCFKCSSCSEEFLFEFEFLKEFCPVVDVKVEENICILESDIKHEIVEHDDHPENIVSIEFKDETRSSESEKFIQPIDDSFNDFDCKNDLDYYSSDENETKNDSSSDIEKSSRMYPTCPCGKTYTYLDTKYFLPHIKIYHPELLKPESLTKDTLTMDDLISNITMEPTQIGKRREKFKCPDCDKIYLGRAGYRVHLIQNHPDTANRLGIIKKHYKCKHCDYESYHPQRFHDHVLRHEKPDAFKCDHCDKAFMSKHNILKHIQGVHFKIRPFVCDQCGTSFTQKSSLNAHVKKGDCHPGTHYKCKHCGEIFNVGKARALHVKAMHARDIYKCEHCSRGFINRKNLNRHLRDSHGIGHQVSFQCSYCTKNFKQKGTCTKHESTHTGKKGFGCDLCDMRFSKRKDLTDHVQQYHDVGCS